MTEPMRAHNEAFQEGAADASIAQKRPCRYAHFIPSEPLVPKLFRYFNSTTSWLRQCLRGWSHTTHWQEEMHSLVQKIRSFLEASWALSPTMVGLACVMLDLAALLHLRIKAAQPAAVEIVRQRGSRE